MPESSTVFKRVLVANRGEIASRLIRACHAAGAEAVAVFSEADAEAPYVGQADMAVAIGPGAPADSYLNIDAVLGAARSAGAEAVHPGYGFLSENPGFAEACQSSGLTWVGPPPSAMRAMADKVDARRLVHAAGVPVVPGTDLALAQLRIAAGEPSGINAVRRHGHAIEFLRARVLGPAPPSEGDRGDTLHRA